jgi:hypothetical protein
MASFKSPESEIEMKISIVIDDYLRGEARISPLLIGIIVASWHDSFCNFRELLRKSS